MTYSKEWDTAYYNGQGCPRHMQPELRQLFKWHLGTTKGQKMLELGCSYGQNARELITSGAKYYGVDAHGDAVISAEKECPGGVFSVQDFTFYQPFGSDFDVVFDRASVSHNTLEAIHHTTDVIWTALKPGGLFIGSDWFSRNHSEFAYGEYVDNGTRTNYKEGQFVNVGNVHFTDEHELLNLFCMFEPVHIIERVNRRVVPSIEMYWESRRFSGREYRTAVFDIVFRRPK